MRVLVLVAGGMLGHKLVRQQRRSLPHLAYAAAQPLSGLLHAALSPLLPPRFRRAAVLAERFGRADA